jgi:hypothetical protein
MNTKTAELSEKEIKEGWHFCPEFDGLLIGPDMDELQVCRCQEEQNELSNGI